MFPHQKLDWNLKRLEQGLDAQPDDVATRLDYALASYSKGRFHGGGEVWLNKALTQARRVLQADPASPGGLIVAGLSLVGLERVEPATRYLDEALRIAPERAEVHVGLGAMYALNGDQHQAVRELELATRLAPDAWECHALLGELLRERASDLGNPARMLERAQFHTVRALQLDPSPEMTGSLLRDLATGCMREGRHDDARKLFQRLTEFPRYRGPAQYYLGLVAFHLGKYKNAILHLRQHLEERPDVPAVHARIGMAFLHLGEVSRAREACNRALAIDPADLGARWTLGCALLEEGRLDEATRLFKEVLADAPDHMAAFTELVRIRRDEGDDHWLYQALRAEVSAYDRLPVAARRGGRGRRAEETVHPRALTRERIAVVLRALASIEQAPLSPLLAAMDLATDEGMRFTLWEAALDRLAAGRASAAVTQLRDAGQHYSARNGRQILALAHVLPEPMLTRGLQIQEEDLRRAAVDRHGPTHDVTVHRRNVDRERREARAWQACLLIAVATRNTRTGRNLLLRWAAEADAELADAARAALAILGDAVATSALRDRARSRGAGAELDRLVAEVSPARIGFSPRPVSDDEELHCSTCGRRAPEVDHLLAGGDAVLCDRCVTEAARQRRELATDDPTVRCALCSNTTLSTRGVYVFRGVAVCSSCVDNGLGLLEREEIDRFLAAWA